MSNAYYRTGLTSGTSDDLDQISEAVLNDKDIGLVTESDVQYIYSYDATSTAVESSPTVITPDDTTGAGRWVFQEPHKEDMTTLEMGTIGTTTIALTSDGSADDVTLPAATITTAGVMTAEQVRQLGGGSLIYGVRWDSVNDIMTPGIILNDTFTAYNYTNFPVQEGLKRGLLTDTGVWSELKSDDSSKFPDGSAATLDGTAGQVMVRIPKHYSLSLTDGDYKYFLISVQPFVFKGETAWIPPAFNGKDEFYLGAFQGVALTDAVDAEVGSCIKSGYTTNPYPNPFTNRNIVQFRAQCAHAVFSQMNYGQYEVIYILALIEYKTWKIQEELEGNTDYASWDYADTVAGTTVSSGNASVSSTTGKTANSYRGIENPFGNVWQWLDGANIDTNDNQRLWICCNPANYASDTTTNYIDSGCANGIDNTDEYIKDVYGTGKYASLFPVSNTGASSSTFISDYLYAAVLGSGWRVLMAGGGLSDGRRAGFGSRSAYSDSSRSISHIGVRLAAAYV